MAVAYCLASPGTDPVCLGYLALAHRFTASVATIAALALLNVAMPEPIVLDLLGTGLASLGFGMICEVIA